MFNPSRKSFFLVSGVYVGVKVNACVQNVTPLKYGFILCIYDFRASEMAKQIKALTVKPDNLSSIPSIQLERRKVMPENCPLPPTCVQ